MVKNETTEDLQASFTAIGQMLGKEERAEQFNTLYTEAYEYLQSFQEQVNAADKPSSKPTGAITPIGSSSDRPKR